MSAAKGSTRMSSAQVQANVCDAMARLIVADGGDVVTLAVVADAASISTARLRRLYNSKPDMFVGLYAEGHHRIESLCARRQTRGVSGLDAVVALAYDLVDQAVRDPVASVVHSLETSDAAADSGLECIYVLWQRQLLTLLVGGDDGPDPLIGGSDYDQVVEVVTLLVAALAGFCAPLRGRPTHNRTLEQVHGVLMALLPVLCADPRHAEHLRQYLCRVRDHLPPTRTNTC